MKKIVLLIIMLQISNCSFAYTSWENSPNNWNNSEYNWNNSSYNWNNSPYNWQNSQYNPNANIIYDNNGNPQGYAVPKTNGSGINLYNFNGKRTNYYNY